MVRTGTGLRRCICSEVCPLLLSPNRHPANPAPLLSVIRPSAAPCLIRKARAPAFAFLQVLPCLDLKPLFTASKRAVQCASLSVADVACALPGRVLGRQFRYPDSRTHSLTHHPPCLTMATQASSTTTTATLPRRLSTTVLPHRLSTTALPHHKDTRRRRTMGRRKSGDAGWCLKHADEKQTSTARIWATTVQQLWTANSAAATIWLQSGQSSLYATEQ